LSSLSYGQEKYLRPDYSQLLRSEKIGVGFEGWSRANYAGFALSNFITDNVALRLTTSLFEIKETFASPMIGVEYNFCDLIPKHRIVPYVGVMYGVNAFERILYRPAENSRRSKIVDVFKHIGPRFELGTKFKIFKHIDLYTKIGVAYRYFNQVDIDDYILKLDAPMVNGNYETQYDVPKVYPTISFNYVIKPKEASVSDSLAVKDYSNLIENEQLSISGGLGYEYGVVGFRASYLFSKSIAVIGTVGAHPKAGIEYRIHSLSKSGRVTPYVNLQFGVSGIYRLSCNSYNYLTEEVICSSSNNANAEKRFLGTTVGLEVKLKLLRKLPGYLSIGANYNNVCPVQLDDFVSDFNSQNGAELSVRDIPLAFSVGYTLILKSKDPEYKLF